MDLKIKIAIINEQNKRFMGLGIVLLLRKIKELKSINKAAKSLNMSYIKALKILNYLEENTGRKFLVRRRGGHDRGVSPLLPHVPVELVHRVSLPPLALDVG